MTSPMLLNTQPLGLLVLLPAAAITRLLPPHPTRPPESVVVGPSGQLVMLDRTNCLHQAWPDAAAPGGWRLEAPALACLGPGRPLGYHFDAAGDLLVADSLKVWGRGGVVSCGVSVS